jgi:cytochrome c peroxidase
MRRITNNDGPLPAPAAIGRPLHCSILTAALLALTVAGCDSGGGSDSKAQPSPATTVSPAAAVGKLIFADTALSASGQQSCQTCHDPAHAFAASDGRAVPLGGVAMNLPGFRNAPSLMYLSFTPRFGLVGGTPTGGFFRDGRASSLAVQAEQPFLGVFEMANADAGEVLQRLLARPYLSQFTAVYGTAVLDDPVATLQAIGAALAAFETEDASFHPFTSKFDYWLQGNATLTAQEALGLALFNDPAKGNCTACHPSQRQGYSDHALFTDFSYDAVGVPRNWNIAANASTPRSPVDGTLLTYIPAETALPAGSEYAYYDLGLCGPFQPPPDDPRPRPDFQTVGSLCGLFKVPTLRNVAVTAPYFHNGAFATLLEVLRWYVTRDVAVNTGNNPDPQLNPYVPAGSFYLAADGSPDALLYNDLPQAFDANVNIGEVPYTPPARDGGQSPTLDDDEIEAVIAFLCTLTDGFDPASPGAYVLPPQCPQAAAGAAP